MQDLVLPRIERGVSSTPEKKTLYDIVILLFLFLMIKVFNSPEPLISPEIISFSFLCQALQNILGIARRSCTYLG
jgi:hypothetical protein